MIPKYLFFTSYIFLVSSVHGQDAMSEEEERIIRSLDKAASTEKARLLEEAVRRISLLSAGEHSEQVRLLARIDTLDLGRDEVIATYSDFLDSESYIVKSHAIKRLLSVGDLSSDILDEIENIAFSGEADSSFSRIEALKLLSKSNRFDLSLLSKIFEIASDQSTKRSLRLGAIDVLGRLENPTSVVVRNLSVLVLDRDPEIQVASAVALLRVGENSSRNFLFAEVVNDEVGAVYRKIISDKDAEYEEIYDQLDVIQSQEAKSGVLFLMLSYMVNNEDSSADALTFYANNIGSNVSQISEVSKQGLFLAENPAPEQLEVLVNSYSSSDFLVSSAIGRVLLVVDSDISTLAGEVVRRLRQRVDYVPVMDLGVHLDLLRKMKGTDLKQFDGLNALLKDNSSLFEKRDRPSAGYMKGYLMLVMMELGYKDELIPFALDGIVSADRSMSFLYAVSCRVLANSLPTNLKRGDFEAYIPSLLRGVNGEFDFKPLLFDEGFGIVAFDVEDATSCQIEAIEALGSLPFTTPEVLDSLRRVKAMQSTTPDPRPAAARSLSLLLNLQK